MYRQKLLRKLYNYHPAEEKEQVALKETIAFVETHNNCFDRSCPGGHLTGSAWLENFDGTKFLLDHHKKLKFWVQLGGHPEPGEHDILQVALREAKEESGLKSIICLDPGIFDISIYWFNIGKEPPHFHFDINFLLKAVDPKEEIKISEESEDLRWFSELPPYDGTQDVDNIFRMFNKWKQGKHRS